MKRILSLILTLCMLVSMLTIVPMTANAVDPEEWDVWDGTSAAPYNSEGSGTAANPYIIRTAEQWANLATATAGTFADGYYIKLAANLDFAKLPGLTPISPDGKRRLIYFDGDGHTIKGVNMTGDKDGIGLFGDIWGDANTGTQTSNIKNLVITDSTFTSTKKYIGALIGETSGHVLVENIYVDKSVIVNGAQGYVGGIIGGCYRVDKNINQEYTVTINDCVFAGTVISGGKYNGGILGFANSANGKKFDGIAYAEIIHVVINRCLVTGIVSPNQEDSCGFQGSNGFLTYVQTQSTTINDSIYAGGSRGEYYSFYPFGKARTMTVTNSYSVSIGRNNKPDAIDAMYEDGPDYLTTGVTLCSIDKFIGLNAEVTVNGWTKRDGDIMIPSGVANFAGTGTVIGALTLPGAAVRLDTPTGIRFSGIIAKAYLDSLNITYGSANVTFGMIIAPTAYVTAAGEFTIEALDAAEMTYNEVEAISVENVNKGTAETNGYYKFNCVLSNVKDTNYQNEFSAISYIKIVDGANTTYIYADSSTSRSIDVVANAALADLSDTQVGEYQYAVTEGEITRYSPYDVGPRGILLGFTTGTQE